MNETLLDRIRPVTRRLRSVRFWRLLAVITFCGAGCAWVIQQQMNADQGHSLVGTLASCQRCGVSVVAFSSAVSVSVIRVRRCRSSSISQVWINVC